MSGGGGGSEGSAGYKYFFGIHAGIGRGPMDLLREIRIGTKLAWQGALSASGDGRIDQPDLFGGEKKEGGVVGNFRLMMGEADQTMYPPLAAMISPTRPTGYRRMVTLFFDGMIAALNPYPKPWAFRMRRATQGWDGEVLSPGLAVVLLQGPVVETSTAYGDAIQQYASMRGPIYTEDPPADLLAAAESWKYDHDNANATCRLSYPPEQCGERDASYTFESSGDLMRFHGTVYNAEVLGGEISHYYSDWYPTAGTLVQQPITVPVPAGGQFISIDRVTTVNAANGGENGEVNVPFTVGSEPNVFTVDEPEFPTSDLLVMFTYRPNLAAGAGIQPDPQIWAMNPAHIVYECLTNREWGRGMDRSVINRPSFEAAAQALYDEGFGMCIRWSRRDSIDSFIQEILDTCGATLYLDRTQALMTFKLIRKDYDRAALPLFTTANGILAITSSTVNTAGGVINEVIVKYREAVYNEDRSVNVQNLASLQSTGGVFNTMTKTYKGLPTSDLARRVAQRDLRANAEGLRRFQLTMDRRGSDFVPGSVFRIQDAARNIPDMVVRVATAKEGTSTDGSISLLVIQDVFSFPATSFVADQPNTWVPPNFTPCIGDHEVLEVPYFLLARQMSAADFAYVDNDSAYAMAVVEQAKSTNNGFELAVRASEPTEDDWPLDGDALYCGFNPADEPDWGGGGSDVSSFIGEARTVVDTPYTKHYTGYATAGAIAGVGGSTALGSAPTMPAGYTLHMALHTWTDLDSSGTHSVQAEQVYFFITGPTVASITLEGITWTAVPYNFPAIGDGWLVVQNYAPPGTPGTGVSDLVVNPAKFLGLHNFTFA